MEHNRTFRVVATPTLTAGAYSAGDVCGGLITLPVQDNATGRGGVVRSVALVDDANQGVACTVYFFERAPVGIIDNAAYAPTVADLAKMVGFVNITAADYVTLNSNKIAIRNVDIPYDLAGTAGNLYAYIVTAGTPTYAADSFTLTVHVWQD